MPSIVKELQKDLLNSETNLSTALNKAYFIARRLNIPDFLTFIENEINGYTDPDKLPAYRMTHGVLKAKNPFRGWEAVQGIPSEIEPELTSVKMFWPIAEMEAVLTSDRDNNDMMIQLSSTAGNHLLSIPMPMAIFFTTYKISAAIEAVRHLLLDWALKLEENGILGEDLSFTDVELATAQRSSDISSVHITAGAGSTINIGSTDNSINNG